MVTMEEDNTVTFFAYDSVQSKHTEELSPPFERRGVEALEHDEIDLYTEDVRSNSIVQMESSTDSRKFESLNLATDDHEVRSHF